MAETLFGEELSIAAAAVAKRVAEESSAAEEASVEAEPTASVAAPVPAANGKQNPMEKEFEKVWGEKPTVDVSIESQIEGHTGGLDISASQRLATVRALNTDNNPESAPAATAQQEPSSKPVTVEEQITTSLTQTLTALNVRPEPRASNDNRDDDDDDDEKPGFFSRFRRS